MYFESYEPRSGKMLQILDPKGKVIDKSLLPEMDDKLLVSIMKHMKMGRMIDERLLKLQRQGRVLTFAPNLGQEAAQVGSAAAIKPDDWMVSAYRELGAWLYKGFPLKNLLLYWSGNEMGSRMPDDVKITPMSVPLASQLQHASGIGYAANYRETGEVVLAYVGDGSTSQGDFHEALNFSAVNNTPNVFIIQNNQWAISTPTRLQTSSESFAGKSYAYGMRGILVDGNDALAVYAATKEAVDLARSGKGPSLIELYTYRMGPHTTSDDPSKYRSDKEVEEWRAKDPIDRMYKYLEKKKLWNEEINEKFEAEFESEFKAVFEEVEKGELVPLEEVIDYTYAKRTPELEKQYKMKKDYYALNK